MFMSSTLIVIDGARCRLTVTNLDLAVDTQLILSRVNYTYLVATTASLALMISGSSLLEFKYLSLLL